MSEYDSNRWKGFVLGALSGVAGILAMQMYWKAATALAGEDPREKTKTSAEPGPLDSISLVGQNHEPGESSTAALGRIIYTWLAGQEPQSEETKTTLSYLVHWAFSMFASGLYGTLRGSVGVPDVPGGLELAVGLWGLGDELAMPLLGLTDGPTAYPPEVHAHGLAAHIAYGLACSSVAQALQRLV